MTIYVVFGTCGEYSDRREWAVCWYPSKAEAAAHAAAATAESAAIDPDVRYEPETRIAHVPRWPPSYTGTEYFVVAVERGRRP